MHVRRTRTAWATLLLTMMAAWFTTPSQARAQLPAPSRCAVGIPGDETSGYVPLPRGDVFCPLLADPKGQRSFVSYLRETGDDGDRDVGSVGISDAFGLLRVQSDRYSRSSGRAMQTRRIGASMVLSARYSTKSRNVGSAQ